MKDNFLNNIGDVLIVKINSSITGEITLSGFLDTIVGETSSRKLYREFRISSSNGLFWSSWKELNDVNLAEKQYVSENYLLIEVRYTRIGTDETGTIEFQNISFLGTREELVFNYPIINSGIFSKIIHSDIQKSIEINLFKKLYYRGVLPNYIKRAENSDEVEDKDFIDLFFSVARFFGLFISFFKRFENFKRDIKTNSEMNVKDLSNMVKLDEKTRQLLDDSAERLALSARAYHRVIKIARTIADLENSDEIKQNHILEAMQYRPKVNI